MTEQNKDNVDVSKLVARLIKANADLILVNNALISDIKKSFCDNTDNIDSMIESVLSACDNTRLVYLALQASKKVEKADKRDDIKSLYRSMWSIVVGCTSLQYVQNYRTNEIEW